MAKYYVKLTLCDGTGTVGPYVSEEKARDKLLETAAWREKDQNETWRSTSHLKWASTNGHILEVIEK